MLRKCYKNLLPAGRISWVPKQLQKKLPVGEPGGGFCDVSEAVWKTMPATLRDTRIARKISQRKLAGETGAQSQRNSKKYGSPSDQHHP